MSSLPTSALDFVLRMEIGGHGWTDTDHGYVDDPVDPGGATCAGITQGTYDAYRRSVGQPTRPVKEIEYPEVQFIYDRDYWRAACCSFFNDAKPRLALVHFDWAVNGGVGRATRYLQSVVGTPVDGVIGPKTLAAITGTDEDNAIGRYLMLRAAHYHLRAADPQATHSQELLAGSGLLSVAPTPDATQQKFLPGWLARLRWCAREAGVPFDPSYAKE